MTRRLPGRHAQDERDILVVVMVDVEAIEPETRADDPLAIGREAEPVGIFG